MSICPRVGGLAAYLDKARMAPMYSDWNRRLKKFLPHDSARGRPGRPLAPAIKDAVKASLHGGMLFEELGFAYIGPIDGHDLKKLRELS